MPWSRLQVGLPSQTDATRRDGEQSTARAGNQHPVQTDRQHDRFTPVRALTLSRPPASERKLIGALTTPPSSAGQHYNVYTFYIRSIQHAGWANNGSLLVFEFKILLDALYLNSGLLTWHKSINQSTNQSINQSINQISKSLIITC